MAMIPQTESTSISEEVETTPPSIDAIMDKAASGAQLTQEEYDAIEKAAIGNQFA